MAQRLHHPLATSYTSHPDAKFRKCMRGALVQTCPRLCLNTSRPESRSLPAQHQESSTDVHAFLTLTFFSLHTTYLYTNRMLCKLVARYLSARESHNHRPAMGTEPWLRRYEAEAAYK